MDAEFGRALATNFASVFRETAGNATQDASLSENGEPTEKSVNQSLPSRTERKHRLPAHILQTKSEEDIDKMFDSDGYLLDEYKDLKQALCHVCQRNAKHKCSQCKNIYYCSAACQKSHWKAHKPMCKITRLRDRVGVTELFNSISLEDKDNEEFINQTRQFEAMWLNGKPYPNVQSLVTDWLGHGPFLRVFFQLTTYEFSRKLNIERTEDGFLVVVERETVRTEEGKVKLPERKEVLPAGLVNVEAYIIQEIETLAMKAPYGILITSRVWYRPITGNTIEATRGEMPVKTVMRGADACWDPSAGWKILQYEPEWMRKWYRYRFGTYYEQLETYMW